MYYTAFPTNFSEILNPDQTAQEKAQQVIVDNGTKKVLVPVSNKRQNLEDPGDLLERVDPIFYSEPLGTALKAVGVR